jgi:hypothetical protein
MPVALTTVPAVLTALVALANTTLVGQGVTVFDGAPDVDNLPDEFLAVGFTRDEDEAAVDGTTNDSGNYTSSEAYDVHCILSCASGDTDASAVAVRRARCADLWSLFAIALRSDPTLGGVLIAGARAELGSWSWIYGPRARGGVYAEVEFDVTVNAAYLGMT